MPNIYTPDRIVYPHTHVRFLNNDALLVFYLFGYAVYSIIYRVTEGIIDPLTRKLQRNDHLRAFK